MLCLLLRCLSFLIPFRFANLKTVNTCDCLSTLDLAMLYVV